MSSDVLYGYGISRGYCPEITRQQRIPGWPSVGLDDQDEKGCYDDSKDTDRGQGNYIPFLQRFPPKID